MAANQSGYLFEVSWEVCNKVGGIYTVITSKLREAIEDLRRKLHPPRIRT